MAEPISAVPLPPQANETGTTSAAIAARPPIVVPVATSSYPDTSVSLETNSTSNRLYKQIRQMMLDAVSGARSKVRYWADEKPLHLAAAIGLAAFVAGVGLRLWRRNHE